MGEAHSASELPEAKSEDTTAEPRSAPSSTARPSEVPMAPEAAIPATISVIAVPLPKMAVAAPPAAKACNRPPRRCSMKRFSRSPQARMMPVRTMRTPHKSSATPPSRLTMTAVPGVSSHLIVGQGSDQVFTLVKLFIASSTPSL